MCRCIFVIHEDGGHGHNVGMFITFDLSPILFVPRIQPPLKGGLLNIRGTQVIIVLSLLNCISTLVELIACM